MDTTSLALLAVWWIAWLAGSAVVMLHARAAVVRLVLGLHALGLLAPVAAHLGASLLPAGRSPEYYDRFAGGPAVMLLGILGFLGVAGLTFGRLFAGVAVNVGETALPRVPRDAPLVRQRPDRALTVATLYRWLLLLPILLPVIVFSLVVPQAVPWAWAHQWLVVLVGSGVFGGLPYLLVLLLTRSRIRTLSRIGMERFLWRLPLLTAPLVAPVTLVPFVLGTMSLSDADWWQAQELFWISIALAALTLVIGYAYVLLIRVGVAFALWLRACVTPPAAVVPGVGGQQ